MNPQADYRHSKGLDVRALDKKGFIGTLIGYAAVFNSPSNEFKDPKDKISWREIMQPTAFVESLKSDRDVVALYQHDTKQILARQSANSLRLVNDERGLLIEMDLVDTQLNRDVFTMVSTRTLDGMSFGMLKANTEVKWERRNGQLIRNVTKTSLVEVSIVTFPAYDDTVIVPRDYQTFRETEKSTSTPVRLLRERQRLEHYKTSIV